MRQWDEKVRRDHRNRLADLKRRDETRGERLMKCLEWRDVGGKEWRAVVAPDNVVPTVEMRFGDDWSELPEYPTMMALFHQLERVTGERDEMERALADDVDVQRESYNLGRRHQDESTAARRGEIDGQASDIQELGENVGARLESIEAEQRDAAVILHDHNQRISDLESGATRPDWAKTLDAAWTHLDRRAERVEERLQELADLDGDGW